MADRGQPTDPMLLDEGTLTAKEIDQGAAYFQLQHMLDNLTHLLEPEPMTKAFDLIKGATAKETTAAIDAAIKSIETRGKKLDHRP